MPIFCVKSVKIYTGQKKFTRAPLVCSWQISGMSRNFWKRWQTVQKEAQTDFLTEDEVRLDYYDIIMKSRPTLIDKNTHMILLIFDLEYLENMLISIYLFNIQKIQAQRKSTKPGWVNADFFHGLPIVEPYIYSDQIGLLYIQKYIVLFFLSLYNIFAEIRWLRFTGESQSLAGWLLISFRDFLIRSSYNRTAHETWAPLYSKVHGVLGLL